jgi:nucleotide-binding universal stress UspA family protein
MEVVMKEILIATDGSPSAQEAVQLGLEIAEEQGADVDVVHVVPALDVPPAAGFGWTPAIPHEVTEHDRAPLNEASELAAGRGIEARTTVLTGAPADKIVAYADSIDAELIVVGSRGHGAIASTLLGSVSRRVLHEARRPVLIVRASPVAVTVAE